MSGPDLTPLERAAERAGLGRRRARLVEPDPRSGRWFDWTDDELLVSERVVERCGPREGEALLLNAVVRSRRRGPAVPLATVGGVAAVLAGLHLWLGARHAVGALACGLLGAAALAGAAVLRARSVLRADDETVARLGDPVPLVRALNAMDTEEIVVGRRHLKARPDLHRRAERLARRHALCSPAGPGG